MKYPASLPLHLQHVFRAFASRNYRLYFSGLGISLIGSWMQNIAMSWLIYRLTRQPFLLGLTAFLTQAPALFLNPLAGVLADRISKRRIIAITQSLAALQAIALAALTFSALIKPWHIIALSLFLGFVMPFDVTARQSFVIDIVGRKDYLGNAIALNSVMFNFARLVGPALAGILITSAGEGACFLANALSYAAALAALWALNIRKAPPSPHHHFLRQLAQGIHYAWHSRPTRALLLLTAFISLIGLPYQTLTPIVAREILAGNARTLGFLNSGVGLGALLGALSLASRPSPKGLPLIVALASALFGASLALFALSHLLPLSLALTPFIGAGILLLLASTNTLLQTITDDHHRGRVVSLFTTAMMGLVPYGCLIVGALAHIITAPATLLICGLLCLSAAIIFTPCLPSFHAELDTITTSLTHPDNLPANQHT
ncbi:MAG: MFS transporter [bacterium]|nr:MFS transporter [bacterium]